MSRALGTLAILVALLWASLAAADEPAWIVARRDTLDWRGIPVQPSTTRIALSGTVTYALDGSTYDALGGDRERTGIAGLVLLPPGSQLVESDPLAHRYVVEVPPNTLVPLQLDIAPIAMRHLTTMRETRANLQGAIMVEQLLPPASPVVAAMRSARSSSSPWLLALLAVPFVLVGVGVAVRGRGEPLAMALRRAARARRSIEQEVAALGPAFDPVARSSARLVEAIEHAADHRRALIRALRRTAWTSAATQAERDRIADRARFAMHHVHALVGRLEQVATQLASQRAGVLRPVEQLVRDLGIDIDSAVEAHDEVEAGLATAHG